MHPAVLRVSRARPSRRRHVRRLLAPGLLHSAMRQSRDNRLECGVILPTESLCQRRGRRSWPAPASRSPATVRGELRDMRLCLADAVLMISIALTIVGFLLVR